LPIGSSDASRPRGNDPEAGSRRCIVVPAAYAAAHPDGYGYTWFCDRFGAFQRRASATFRNRHEAGAVMQTDYAGHTVPIVDPDTGVIREAQIFVAVLGASSFTFAFASRSQKLPDWIEGQCRALTFFGGVTKAIVCDNLKAGVARALWFEPTLNQTFAAMAEHYDTTILPTRSRKPRDKGKVEGAVLIVERWILADCATGASSASPISTPRSRCCWRI